MKHTAELAYSDSLLEIKRLSEAILKTKCVETPNWAHVGDLARAIESLREAARVLGVAA